jgi:hypothetical protein
VIGDAIDAVMVKLSTDSSLSLELFVAPSVGAAGVPPIPLPKSLNPEADRVTLARSGSQWKLIFRLTALVVAGGRDASRTPSRTRRASPPAPSERVTEIDRMHDVKPVMHLWVRKLKCTDLRASRIPDLSNAESGPLKCGSLAGLASQSTGPSL